MYPRLKFDISYRLLWRTLLKPTPCLSNPVWKEYWPQEAECGAIIPALSVRTAFDGLLTALALPPASKIVMSAINIQAMTDIAQAHGLEIVAVDIDPQTLAPNDTVLLNAVQEHKAKICLVSHLFGAVNSSESYSKIRRLGALVVEDAAQAFNGDFYLGDRNADVSLFSFGPIKKRTALGGALAVLRDPVLAQKLNQTLLLHDQLPTSWLRKRAAKYLVLKTLSHPTIYRILCQLLIWAGRDVDQTIGGLARGFRSGDWLSNIRFRPPEGTLALMDTQLRRTSTATERHEICSNFSSLIPDSFGQIGLSAAVHCHWLFPICTQQPEALRKYLFKHGFDATRGTTSLRVLDNDATPIAKEMFEQLLFLPNPTDLPADALKRLADVLISWYAEKNELA